MRISSPSFTNNEFIPSKFTCDGENINPRLDFSELPDNTKSLALVMHDPDAPSKDWLHWIVWDLDPTIQSIPENVQDLDAVIGINDFGVNNYGGPCPPSGDHRYYFDLYALAEKVSYPRDAAFVDVMERIHSIILEKTVIIGIYGR